MPRSRWLWLLAVVALIVATYALAPRITLGQSKASTTPTTAPAGRGGRGDQSGGATPVGTATAETGDMPVYLTALGTATPLRTVTLHTRVDGQLVRVNFKEGQLVHTGDLLAEIDPRPFQVMVTQAEGQRAKDEAALKNAQLDLQRYQALFAQDAVSKQQLDTQVATVNQDEGALKTDEGQIAAARLNLIYARITSPITGRVGIRLVDPGNIVHAADQNGLVVITERQPIAVVFTIPQDNLEPVLQQQHAGKKLPVDAYDRDLKTKLASGELSSIDSQIDTTTGTIKLKATFANEHETLFPNQFVNARLLVDTLHGVVIVPAAAIQRGPQQTFVYVVGADQTVSARNVRVSQTEGDRTAVQSGLRAGEVVVVDGVDKLEPGSKVTPRPAAAAAPGS